jgi:hypothetical protein
MNMSDSRGPTIKRETGIVAKKHWEAPKIEDEEAKRATEGKVADTQEFEGLNSKPPS